MSTKYSLNIKIYLFVRKPLIWIDYYFILLSKYLFMQVNIYYRWYYLNKYLFIKIN